MILVLVCSLANVTPGVCGWLQEAATGSETDILASWFFALLVW